MQLPNQDNIRILKEKETCKYLGILEADTIEHLEIKERKIKKEFLRRTRGFPRGVMVKAMDCGIVVSEFVYQSPNYLNFRANTLGKGMNPLILPAMG